MKAIAVALVAAGISAATFGADSVPTFNRDIRPILADRCFHCHGPDANRRKADLRLDIEDIAKKEMIVPGDPDASPVMARITSQDPDEHMPPLGSLKESLTPAEVELFRAWIAAGAKWEKHWAFVAPVKADPPTIADAEWARNPIDQFVAARLEAEGLAPSPEANRANLIRRASFDLTGLPPSPEEIDAFVNDASPDAYEKVVDRLLASPHYGERMAMDWLDGARYADTNGYQNDFQRYMWPWRDWVINAYNANEPFDQFTIEQIAGDLLPDPTTEQRVATGFNRNNRANTEGGSIEAEWRVENMVDRIETTSAVWMGLSMGCARCHDHKYDPITQKEFYQFFAFFNSSADKGFYEETRGNAGPQVSLPSEENDKRLAEFDAAITDAQAKVEASKAEVDAAFAKWRESYLPKSAPAAILGLPLDGTLRVSAVGALAATIPSPARKLDGEGGWTDGPLGKGVYLDGKGDSGVEVGTIGSIEWNRPFAVSCWVNPGKPGAIFSQMDDAHAFRGFDTLIDDNGILTVHIVHEWPGNAIKVISETGLPKNEWSQLTLSYDGSGKAAGVSLFVDGKSIAVKVDTDTLTDTIQTDQPFRLGRRMTEQLSRITISDVRVYDQALNETDIAVITENAFAKSVADEASDSQVAFARAFYNRTYAADFAVATETLTKAQGERAEYVKNEVPTVMVMEEAAEPMPTYRLVRGQYDAPDETEPLSPGVPAFLPSLPDGAPANRLGLAKWLVARENPLTARVNVNRLWTKFFGTGLVKTAEDFGLQGSPPSHPELLDWLAVELMDEGWDLKAFQKLIVTSATYRQASGASPELLERDPENILLARGPRFRLQAELVRDNALAVSGLLAEKIGGPSVMPYQPENLWADLAGGAGQGPYIQSEGDDLYRRSLYTYRKRTVPHPTMATFDAPSFELCRVRRSRTNTPLQALALLNGTTYVEAARQLATRMVTEATGDTDARLAYGFRLATCRKPSTAEVKALRAGYDLYQQTYSADPEAAKVFVSHGESPLPENIDPVELAPYTAVAAVVLNLDEAITKN